MNERDNGRKMPQEQVRLPGNSDHVAIIGRNGSGKTQAAAFHLSLRNFDVMPWVVLNSKGDALLTKISKMDGARNISLKDTPKRAGLYFVRPIPEVDDEELQDFFWRIWARGKTGVFADEGYMMPRGGSFNAMLTQGRAKKIPMIVLLQRPVFASKFILTEANYMQIFDLTHADDQDTLRKFVAYDAVETLPPYHSLWYDVRRKRLTPWAPVPDEATLLETFRQRLLPRTRYL